MSDERRPTEWNGISRRQILRHILGSPVYLGLCSATVAAQDPPAAPTNPKILGKSPADGAVGLTHLMGIGGVTNRSARYRARAESAATLRIEYSTSSNLAGSTLSSGVAVVPGDDFTGGETIIGLTAATTYYYSILVNGVRAHTSPFPRFRTFPAPGVDASLLIVFGGDQNTSAGTACYASIAAEDPDLFIHLGDFGHPDVGGDLTLQRANYKTQYADAFLSEIVRKMARVHIWDDHDYWGNNANGDSSNKASSLQAFKEYMPMYTLANPSNGLWHSFRIANTECFVLDTRYQREGSKPQFGVGLGLIADTGSSGSTLVLRSADGPSAFANHYNTYYASVTTPSGTFIRRVRAYTGSPTRRITLSAPVPGLDNTSTYYLRRASMLDMDGIADGQIEWLIAGMNASTAKWKILVTSVIWNPSFTGSDAWNKWDNSAIEQQYLTQELAGIDNLIILSADRHASAIDDGTTSGWPEATAGPFNAQAYDVSGTWSNGKYKAGHSYGVLAIGADSATLMIKDVDGKLAGTVAPLTVNAV